MRVSGRMAPRTSAVPGDRAAGLSVPATLPAMDVDSTTMLVGTGLFGLALFVWIFCAYLAYQTAPKRGRRAGVWAALAIVFGPLALFALYVMAPKAGRGRGEAARSARRPVRGPEEEVIAGSAGA